MKIKRLKCKNFRSLEDFEVRFNPHYNALSGKNNSGKSNIIRAILNFLTYEMRILQSSFFSFAHYPTDYPHWKKKSKEKDLITLEIELELDENLDAGLFKFIKELIFKNEEEFKEHSETLLINAQVGQKVEETKVTISFGDHVIEDEYKRDELINRLRGSSSVLFHNSTESVPYFFKRGRHDSIISYLGESDRTLITKRKESLESTVKKCLKKHQYELGIILGRLQDKYDVVLGVSSLDLDRENVEISLKEKGIEVSLDEWGSGTKNRTLILLNLMNARRAQDSSSVNERLTPILIIEEPESFLHPSAQAEFGRILQDLASEFNIQIIVATHSPYLLSHKEPSANILLERNISGQLKGSQIVNTSHDKWYEPFALSLGIHGSDFGDMKSAIFSDSSDIIFVEGETDKEYLELLKDDKHGKHKLKFSGDIFPYGGAGNIKNNIWLRFVKDRFRRFLITIDLDKFSELKDTFESLGFRENHEYLLIGKNETGKKCIEGLVPDGLLSKVYSENAEIVRKTQESSKDGKNAKSQLKRKILDRFKHDGLDNNEYYLDFYELTRKLNKIFG